MRRTATAREVLAGLPAPAASLRLSALRAENEGLRTAIGKLAPVIEPAADIPELATLRPAREAVFAHLLADAKRRIAAQPKRYFPKVYGETDGGGTQCLYLAPAGIPFEKLGLPDLGPEPVPDKATSLQHALYQGMVAPAVLYAALGFVVWRNRKKGEQGKEGGR